MGTQLPIPKKGDRAPKFSAHVYCGQTAGWIKMPLGMEVGFGPCHIVLDGDPAPPKKGHSPPFSADVYCSQTARWIKMPVSTKVGISPGNIVFDANRATPPQGAEPPIFGPCLLWPNGRPSQLLLSTRLLFVLFQVGQEPLGSLQHVS